MVAHNSVRMSRCSWYTPDMDLCSTLDKERILYKPFKKQEVWVSYTSFHFTLDLLPHIKHAINVRPNDDSRWSRLSRQITPGLVTITRCGCPTCGAFVALTASGMWSMPATWGSASQDRIPVARHGQALALMWRVCHSADLSHVQPVGFRRGR